MACPGGMFGGMDERCLREMMGQALPVLQEVLGPALAQAAQTQCTGPAPGMAGPTGGAGPQCHPGSSDNPLAAMFQHYQDMMQKCSSPDTQSEWSTKVQLRGFQADEIHVKVDPEERMVKVQAQHESGDEEGFDRREAARYIRVPDDVIAESIKVSHRPNGYLVVIGKRETTEKKTNADEKKSTCEGVSNKMKNDASEERKQKHDVTDSKRKFQFQVSGNGQSQGEAVPIVTEPDSFSVEIDVSRYKPEDLAVKVTGDQVTITGKKEGDQDGGLHRKYTLPSHVDAERLKSTLSPEGILRVTAPNAKETKVAIELEQD